MSQNLVIIPTYNEIENIEKMVRKVFSLKREFDLLIVDDGSPDGTAKKVKELQGEFPRLFIEERSGKLKKAPASLGCKAYPTGYPAPGTYVHER